MSNSVYGYINLADVIDSNRIFSLFQIETGLGIRMMESGRLYGFSEKERNTRSNLSLPFEILSSPKSDTAELLLNGIDYIPDWESELPRLSRDRLSKLANSIEFLCGFSEVEFLKVAVTQCNCIEGTIEVSMEEFKNRLLADCAEYCPPDLIYKIKVK